MRGYRTRDRTRALTSTDMADDKRRLLRCDRPPSRYADTASWDRWSLAFQLKVRSKITPRRFASEVGERLWSRNFTIIAVALRKFLGFANSISWIFSVFTFRSFAQNHLSSDAIVSLILRFTLTSSERLPLTNSWVSPGFYTSTASMAYKLMLLANTQWNRGPRDHPWKTPMLFTRSFDFLVSSRALSEADTLNLNLVPETCRKPSYNNFLQLQFCRWFIAVYPL